MVPAGARARVLVLSALAALPAGAGPAGLPKQPVPKLLAATDAARGSLAPPDALPRRQPPAAASRALFARERRLTTDYAQLAKLVASPDAAAGDFFGISVAIDGNTVVAGAYSAGTGGAAYVLRTTDGGATYAQVAKLTASDAAAGDHFGKSVAIDGNTIVVGANQRKRRHGLVLRLPHDRRRRHVRPGGQADGRRRRGERLRLLRGDLRQHHRGRGLRDDAGSYRRGLLPARPTAAPRTARWPS